MNEQDSPKERNDGGAVTEVATMLMKAAFMLPIGTLKAACDMQKKMLEMMEGLMPAAVAGDQPGATADPPSPAAGAAASPSPGPRGSAGGWGPVTPQDPATGWGPMPR